MKMQMNSCVRANMALTLSGVFIGLQLGSHIYSQETEKVPETVIAQRFVLVDAEGNERAQWTVGGGNPRLEFLGRDGLAVIELGLETNSNPLPIPNKHPYEPHLSFFDDRKWPLGDVRLAMDLRSAGPLVHQTFYEVKDDGSSPMLRLEADASYRSTSGGAGLLLAGPAESLAQLGWVDCGALKLFVGGGRAGTLLEVVAEASGVVRVSNGEREKTLSPLD